MVTMHTAEASDRTVLPHGSTHRRDDLVGDRNDRRCLAGGDVGKVGRVARIHGPLLETLEIEVADRRPNRLGLQRHQHDEVMGPCGTGWQRARARP